MKTNQKKFVFLISVLFFISFGVFIFGQIHINQLGYNSGGYKTAVFESAEEMDAGTFELLDNSGKVVFSGNTQNAEKVPEWSENNYYILDFSEFERKGVYKIVVGEVVSYHFEINERLTASSTVPLLVSAINSMRDTGNPGDTAVPIRNTNIRVNMLGGYRDATGDHNKHFSHLSYAAYFNPQQAPMVAFSLLSALENTSLSDDLREKMKKEVYYSMDYLNKSLSPDGFFYISVFDQFGSKPETREICCWGTPESIAGRTDNYRCSFREGAGIAIAAFCKAYLMEKSDLTKHYLEQAEKAFEHLTSGEAISNKVLYNENYPNNLLDDYTSLIASVHLYKATGGKKYLDYAIKMVDLMLGKFDEKGFFYSDEGRKRVHYHAVDEGMPYMSMLDFAKISQYRNEEIKKALRAVTKHYLKISETNNPFGYIRQYSSAFANDTLCEPQVRFFMPHNNETGYWWQGENARIMSLSYALTRICNEVEGINKAKIQMLVANQFDWLLGKNPFDVCMLYGLGQVNFPQYFGASTMPNPKGMVCNGITSRHADGMAIEWMPYDNNEPKERGNNWRWIEGWLPHITWTLMASSIE